MTEQEAAVQALQTLLQGNQQPQDVSSWVADWARTVFAGVGVGLLGAIWKYMKDNHNSSKSQSESQLRMEKDIDSLRKTQLNQGRTLQHLVGAAKIVIRQQAEQQGKDPTTAELMMGPDPE